MSEAEAAKSVKQQHAATAGPTATEAAAEEAEEAPHPSIQSPITIINHSHKMI